MFTNTWQVFKDTGDPMCYLIYRAENKSAAFRTTVSGDKDTEENREIYSERIVGGL